MSDCVFGINWHVLNPMVHRSFTTTWMPLGRGVLFATPLVVLTSTVLPAQYASSVARVPGIEAHRDVRAAAQSSVREGGTAMTQWKDVALGRGLKMKVPSDLTRGRDQGIDTNASNWQGKGINVLVDQGPFADPLTSSASRTGSRSTEESIGGRPARIVSYVNEAGTRVIAAHVAGSRRGASVVEPVTVVIRLDPEGPSEEVARTILRSLRFGGS
jgi:hypothetical protein